MISSHFLIRLCAVGIFSLGAPCFGQLERCLEAHGGIVRWQSFGSVEYDLTWENAKGAKKDHQLFNLRTRDGLITSAAYTLGSAKGEVWITPGLEALGGTPPRFYMWTPFYFFGMPFVFADPGATQESLGRKSFQGREYDTTRVTFKSGTGDSPEDYYVTYVDPDSAQLKLVEYVVTFPSIRKNKPLEQLEPHAILFEEWQQADGVLVPKAASFYNWKNGNIEGEPLGRLTFSAVRFIVATPDSANFAKPAGAVVAPLR
jgi:hypothetical protein